MEDPVYRKRIEETTATTLGEVLPASARYSVILFGLALVTIVIIATCNFDITGTTKIGKYYFNHSFMFPGLIGVRTACCLGYLIAQVLI